MAARFTKEETAERKRCEAIIQQPDSEFPSLASAQRNKRVAALRIKQLRKEAEQRLTERRNKKNLVSGTLPAPAPVTITRLHVADEWSPERTAAFQAKLVAGRKPSGTVFLSKVAKAPGEVKPATPTKPKPVESKPVSTSPARVTVTDPEEKYCEIHSCDLDQCGCASPQPTSAALHEQHEADAKEDRESRMPGTPCPICLIDRSFCQHSGRVSSATEFARSIFTASR